MADTIAALNVEIGLNFAKLQEGLKEVSGAVNRSAASMKDAFGDAGKSLLSFAGSVASVAGVIGGLKSAISFGDELQTMNERLGISVQKLQELSGIAVQNNTSIEALGKSFKFLGENMVKAQTAGTEQNRLFVALGVATKDAAGNLRAVDEVTADTADALNQIGNETVRTAAGVAIFGKSYLEIAAALRTFRESQEAANAIIVEFGAVTATVTKTADTFGDKLNLLGQGFKAATLVGITPGISAFNSALEAITPTIAVLAKAFGDFFGWLGEKAAVILINTVDLFKKLGAVIGAVAASIATLSLDPLKELQKDIARLDVQRVADLAKVLTSAKFPGLDDSDQVSRAAAAMGRLADRTKAVQAALGGVDTAFATAFANINKVLQAAQERMEDFGKSISEQTSPSMKALLNIMASPEWEKFSAQQQQQIIDIGLTADAIDHEVAARRQLEEELKTYYGIVERARGIENAGIDKMIQSIGEFKQGLEDQNKEYEFQITLIGKTAVEQERLTALHRIDVAEQRELAKLGEDALLTDIERIRAAADLARAQANAAIPLRDSLEQQARAGADLFRNLTEAGANFITDFVEHGSSSFKRLWDDFKHWALEAIAKIAAQQIVLSLIPSLAPAAGLASGATGGIGGLLGGIFGGGGGGLFSGIGQIFSPLQSLFSGSGILGTLGTSFANLNLAMTAGIGSIGGFGAGLTALLPALGAIGGAIGLAVAAFGAFSKGGGPKEGGFAAVGVERGSYFPTESTPAGDEAIKKLVDSVSDSFKEALKKLGGQALDIGFALGFDTDPKGHAPSNVHGGVFKGGQSIYENPNPNVGRSPEELQAELQHQAQQMLLAALQSSDLPKYVAALLNSVDVAAASSDEITQILQTAEAIKGVADAFPDLQAQIENLDPDQIKAFIDALGGADQLTASFAYLAKNFTLATDQTKKNADDLTSAFTNLGLQVPATHQAFMDLLASFDLTTEEGRNLYASVIALAPAFVAVAGSADEAAKKLQSASDFFAQNFYSDAEKNAAKLKSEIDQLNGAQAQLGITIPRTVEGFRALIESLDRTTPAGEALYEALIALAPAILDVSKSVGGLTVAAGTANQAIQTIITTLGAFSDPTGADLAQSYIDKIKALADQIPNAGLGEKLAFEIDLINKQIKAALAKAHDPTVDQATRDAYELIAARLGFTNDQMIKELARFTVLTAQYGDATAEQLLSLEDWYNQQKNLFYGDAATLAALDKVFKERWDAIIKGIADGVGGAIDQLAKLRQSIADYLKGLQISDLSPLTPAQKLAEAQKQYEDELAKAAKGDPTALADITKFADAYLKQARDFYASSGQYTDIFKMITEELAKLAGTDPFGNAPGTGTDRDRGFKGKTDGDGSANWFAANEALLHSLPSQGERLLSVDDLKKATDSLGKLIADALAAVADANTEDTAGIRDELKSTAVKIVDGLGGNLK